MHPASPPLPATPYGSLPDVARKAGDPLALHLLQRVAIAEREPDALAKPATPALGHYN